MRPFFARTLKRVETPSAAERPARFIDLPTLMRARSIQLRARVVVNGFRSGIHRSPYHGFSAEFSEYRTYVPGDDLRYLDWRLYARTDRYSIKRFEDETNLACHLLVDASRSMLYTSGSYSKSDYARTLAAALAYLLSQQHDAVGLVLFDESIRHFLPPRHRPGQLRRIMGLLEQDGRGRATNLANPLEQVAASIHKRGLVILISDLLAPLDEWRESLRHLRARGHDLVVVQVLDPVETTFDLDTPGLFQDAESGRSIYVDPQSASAMYRERFEAHIVAIRDCCIDHSIDFLQATTDRPLELVMADILRTRVRRGRQRTYARAGRDGS